MRFCNEHFAVEQARLVVRNLDHQLALERRRRAKPYPCRPGKVKRQAAAHVATVARSWRTIESARDYKAGNDHASMLRL